MKYLRIVDNNIIYPYNIGNLRKEFPNTSFPFDMNTIDLADYNIFVVNTVSPPSDENYSKIVTEVEPQLIDNEYFQTWNVEDASAEYTENSLRSNIENQWEYIRNNRNRYLSECDWTMLPDSPLTTEKKEEWVIYRQALRDITLQEDPFNIIWPTKPE